MSAERSNGNRVESNPFLTESAQVADTGSDCEVFWPDDSSAKTPGRRFDLMVRRARKMGLNGKVGVSAQTDLETNETRYFYLSDISKNGTKG